MLVAGVHDLGCSEGEGLRLGSFWASRHLGSEFMMLLESVQVKDMSRLPKHDIVVDIQAECVESQEPTGLA